MRLWTATALVGVLLLTGCAATSADPSGEGEPEPDTEPTTYGFSAPGVTSPAAQQFLAGIECYAAANGDGEVTVADSGLDITKQIADVQAFMAQGKDVVVLLPFDTSQVASVVAEAEARGTSIVEIMNPASDAPGSVSTDPSAYGVQAAEYLDELYPEGSEVAVIGGPAIPLIEALLGGFIDAAAENGITIVETVNATKFTVDEGQAVGNAILVKNPDIDAIFSFDETLAIGAGLAAEGRGRDDLTTIGQGGSPESIQAIKDGNLSASWSSENVLGGYLAAEIGARLARGEQVEPTIVDWVRFDAENAADWLPNEQKCAQIIEDQG
ncbi:sugar ABC transporter substrate-binding protein [Microbacterium sp. ARD31]|nr:sugar ABC transporter substrate-binding protein [Microbacterium sp. ARD31]